MRPVRHSPATAGRRRKLAPCSLDNLHRPKGENRTAQAFRPGKAYEKKIALKGPPTSGRYAQKVAFVKSDSMAFQKQKSAGTIRCERDWAIKHNNNISLRWQPVPVRPPFQGDSVVRVVPRAEALGYSLFALRATPKCPNSRGRLSEASFAESFIGSQTVTEGNTRICMNG